MKSKTLNIVLIGCLFTSAQFCHALANGKLADTAEHFALHIYLPREITIDDDTIDLGQVSIIRGEGPLVDKASEIALGRMFVPGQRIVIDRPMILSRLACNGIPVSKVRLTGAEKITVKQQKQIISGGKFVALANSFLKKNPLDRSLCQLKPMRIPKDLVLADANANIELSAHVVKGGARGCTKVQIGVLADGEEIGVRQVPFRLKYKSRKVMSLVDIPAGMSISPENVKIEENLSNYPEPANWNPPYGLVAKRRIPANAVIYPYMVASENPVVVVKRNQTVVIRIERPGLLITAMGRAMQDGRSGEYIKVKNIDSQRTVFARVNDDGTVEPVF